MSGSTQIEPRADMFALPFEQLETGLEHRSEPVPVRAEDVVAFAGLTGDQHPVHVDPDWAATSPFGRPIGHGLLVLSMAVGALPLDPERVVALRRIREATFKRPVYVGEAISMRARIAELRKLDGVSGLVACECRVEGPDERLRVRAMVELLWRRADAARGAPAITEHAPRSASTPATSLDPVLVAEDGTVSQVLL